MGKFSRIFNYISKEDLKRVHEQKVRVEKLESERIEEERKEIKAEFEQLKSNWRKDISESDFTNITKGNRIAQTFQHTSGATITLDNTMSDTSDIPTQVTLDLGFGEKITVDAPSQNQFGITGVTKRLGITTSESDTGGGETVFDKIKELDKKVMQKQSVKTADEINQQLDASEKASGAESARVDSSEGITEKAIQTAWKLISKLPNTRFNQELKVLFGYLSGNFKGSIDNKFISKDHLTSLFKKASLRGDGRVQMDDFIVGSGQKLVYNPKTNTWGVSFNYDFAKNSSELATSNPGWLKRTLGPILFGQYSHDANMFGPLVQHAKNQGRGQNIKGEFTIDADELSKLNPTLVWQHLSRIGGGSYGSKIWSRSLMDNAARKGTLMGSTDMLNAVHNYYAVTGQLPPTSKPKGSVEYNYGDHPEYDPKEIARIDRIKKAQAAPLEPSNEPDTYNWRKDAVVRKKKVKKDT